MLYNFLDIPPLYYIMETSNLFEKSNSKITRDQGLYVNTVSLKIVEYVIQKIITF